MYKVKVQKLIKRKLAGVWGGSYKPTSQYNHNYSTITRVHRGGSLKFFGEAEEFGGKLLITKIKQITCT